MVFQSDFGGFGETKEMAYDLRQGLAFVLIDTLRNIAMYREERDYKKWFEALDGLFIDISMKLDSKKPKEGEKSEVEQYNDMVVKANKAIKESPSAYMNKGAEGLEIYKILKDINIWLLKKMEKYKMFGSKGDYEGLV